MNNEFDDIFSNSSNEQVEVIDLNTPTEEKKKISFDFNIRSDKVLLAQLLLLGIWLILTIIIYFFGYPLFEPFINGKITEIST